MTHDYRTANFVSATPTDSTPILPALPPAHAVEIVPHDADLAIEDVLARAGSIRAIEKTSPLLSAQAFMIKYAGLSATLLVLSVGLTWLTAAPAPMAIVTFAGLSFLGYFALGWTEAQFTTAGVERLRLREGAKTLRYKIDADRDVQLAQVELQTTIVGAQTEYNRQQDSRLRERIAAQVAYREAPQMTQNRQANYVPPDWLRTKNSVVSVALPEENTGNTATIQPVYATPAPLFLREELTPPSWMQERTARAVRDDARRKLTEFIASLYERDESGSWLRLHEDGRIRRDVKTPMSARSGLSAPLRSQIDGILQELDRCGAWLVRYDGDQRLYRLNLSRYPDADGAIDAIADVPTPRLM